MAAAAEYCWVLGVELKKRVLDLAIAVPGYFAVSPLLWVIAVAIRLTMGKPVLFKQVRPGKDGTPFVIYKFRTMNQARGSDGRLLPDEKRLTRIGKFLRVISLDELPELFNVLKGDMSIVGPRPLLMQYLDRYTPEQTRRHEMKPGLTGWAQVNGRNAITWEEKFRYDVWYVDNWSMWLDIKILLMTLIKVLNMEGINQPGNATMEKFQGSGGDRGGQIQAVEISQD